MASPHPLCSPGDELLLLGWDAHGDMCPGSHGTGADTATRAMQHGHGKDSATPWLVAVGTGPGNSLEPAVGRSRRPSRCCLTQELSRRLAFLPQRPRTPVPLPLLSSDLSTWFVVMKTILASVEATPSSALRRPLKVRRPMPWYAVGSGGEDNSDWGQTPLQYPYFPTLPSAAATHAPAWGKEGECLPSCMSGTGSPSMQATQGAQVLSMEEAGQEARLASRWVRAPRGAWWPQVTTGRTRDLEAASDHTGAGITQGFGPSSLDTCTRPLPGATPSACSSPSLSAARSRLTKAASTSSSSTMLCCGAALSRWLRRSSDRLRSLRLSRQMLYCSSPARAVLRRGRAQGETRARDPHPPQPEGTSYAQQQAEGQPLAFPTPPHQAVVKPLKPPSSTGVRGPLSSIPPHLEARGSK